MYSDVMQRTQISLSEEEHAALELAANQTGASRAELIRRAIRLHYGKPATSDRLAALQTSAGTWAERCFTGAEYVDAVRRDADDKVSTASRP